MKILHYLSIFALIFLQGLQGQDPARLKTDDISPIMKQIFEQHLDQKNVSPELAKNAVRLYIDHFDGSRVYLLDSEVAPFLNKSDAEWKKIAQEIQLKDYTIFSQLDVLFQKAISRARGLRHLTARERVAVFEKALKFRQEDSNAQNDLSEDLKTFVADLGPLRQRWRELVADYVQTMAEQSNAALVRKRQREVVEHLEENTRQTEVQYLYVDQKGAELTSAEKQHYFALHVLKALASALDPHSAFFDNAEAFEMKAHLDKGFDGIGVVFFQAPDGIIVNEVIPDSPAAKSGLIKAKDQILAINGEKLSDKSIDEVMEMMRNQHDQPITLLLKHPSSNRGEIDHVLEVRLTPQKITLNNDRTEWGYEPYQDGILGWITLHSFYEGSQDVNSAQDIKNALADLRTHGDLKGLILDLRDNGGGYLTQAIKVVSLFIDDGVVVISKYNDGTEHFYRDIGGKATYNGPLIVLASRLTASAAEIVAQALQDYGVALVVGDDRTFGKGTIQAQTVTSDNSTSYFKVTVGKYYTVSGKTAQLTGVKSDIEVPGPFSHLHVGEIYLKEALPTDQIEPAYTDKLQDIDPFVRDWYLRYYVPSIQHELTQWKDLAPTLKTLSAQRLKSDSTYRNFIDEVRHQYRIASIKALMTREEKAHHNEDPQLSEALAILQDMHRLSHSEIGSTAQKIHSEWRLEEVLNRSP